MHQQTHTLRDMDAPDLPTGAASERVPATERFEALAASALVGVLYRLRPGVTGMRGRDPIRKGGPRDPVAQEIRRQQNQAAAPSAEEVKAERQRKLAKEGCEVCGCDDPTNLHGLRVPYAFCGNGQAPREPFERVVLCDEHFRPAGVLARARMVQRARRKGADALAVYECGATVTASWDAPDEEALRERMGPRMDGDTTFDDLRLRSKLQVVGPPEVPVFHTGRGCGAKLAEVILLGGGP